ncbi:MAG: nucleotidyltransferase family protein [Elusimicrobia bacterium]|nr:nucleotidyltransferase family protein [Elusimicrobiota bacterium]
MEITAVIVAGGRGERMRPLTDRVPKPMLPVAGRPLLEHQLDWLKRGGVARAVMCLGYRARFVQSHFEDGRRWGVELDYCVEDSPRGTAGCVRDAWDKVPGEALVVYGDIFVDISLPPLLEAHRRLGADATLVVADTDHPYDSDLVRVAGGRVTGFYRAKPGQACAPLAAAAVWVVGSRLMELVPRDRPSDFGRDIFPEALQRGLVLGSYKTDELIADLGTPARMAAFAKRRAGLQT